MMYRALPLLLCVAVLGGSTGCHAYQVGATIGYDDELLRSQPEERISDAYDAELTANGTRLRAKVLSRCDLVERNEIERTHRQNRTSTMRAGAVVVSILGAALVGGGAYLLATGHSRPESVYRPERIQDLELDRATTYGLGAGGLAVGSTGLFWGIGHGIQVARDERTVELREEDGRVIDEDVACSTASPAAGAELILDLPGNGLSLGATDSLGRLTVDLFSLVPRAELVGLDAIRSAPLMLGVEQLGTVDLAPVIARHEAIAWERSEHLRCSAPRTAADCAALMTFAREFPSGAHAAQAQNVLARARTVLAAVASRQEAERLAAAERAQAEQAALRAEAERQQLELERARQVEAERVRVEQERRQREYEQAAREREAEAARARVEQERRQREYEQIVRERMAERAAQRTEEREAERRERARRTCANTCRTSCGGVAGCVAECIRDQCR